MTSDKALNILKRVVVIGIQFAVYILIINLVKHILQTDDGWSEEIGGKINAVCFILAMILTTIYNLVTIRLLKLEYEKTGDYILSLVVFLLVDIIYCYIVSMPGEKSEFFTPSPVISIELSLQSLSMYVLGNSFHVLTCYFFRSISNREYVDMMKRAILAMILYIIYILSTSDLIFEVMIWVTPFFYYCFSINFLEDSGKYIQDIQDHIVSLGIYFNVIGICVVFKRYIGFAGGLIITVSLFIYLWWCFIHFVIRRIRYSVRKGKNAIADEPWKEDDKMSGEISSEMILIPGIDENLRYEENEGNKEGKDKSEGD